MTKSMCPWCNRAPREPHLDNCPNLTGIPSATDYGLKTRAIKGDYLRRSMSDIRLRNVLPRVMYFVERGAEPDTPKDLYEFDKQMGWQ